jgi:hypothetical protein
MGLGWTARRGTPTKTDGVKNVVKYTVKNAVK